MPQRYISTNKKHVQVAKILTDRQMPAPGFWLLVGCAHISHRLGSFNPDLLGQSRMGWGTGLLGKMKRIKQNKVRWRSSSSLATDLKILHLVPRKCWATDLEPEIILLIQKTHTKRQQKSQVHNYGVKQESENSWTCRTSAAQLKCRICRSQCLTLPGKHERLLSPPETRTQKHLQFPSATLASRDKFWTLHCCRRNLTGSWYKTPSYCWKVHLLSVQICAEATFPSPEKRKEHNQNKICILYFRKNNASHSLGGMRSCSQETSLRLVGFIPRRALLSGNSQQRRKLEERGGNSGTYWRLCCLFLLRVKEEKTANKRTSAVATGWCRVRFTKCLLVM